MDILITYITTNPRGLTQREQRRLSGPVLKIGRGTQCDIQLPDPRVALEHVSITVTAEGVASIKAEAGVIELNERRADGARLSIGDRITVGPYLFQVDASPTGLAWALSVSLTQPLPDADGDEAAPAKPALSKRRLSYLLFFGVLLFGLLAPAAYDYVDGPASPHGKRTAVQAVSAKFEKIWDPGQLSRGHQIFGADCRSCHQTPFVQVRDEACVACHKSVKEHSVGSEGFAQIRCAECHRDHKGASMVPHAQEQCVDCHRDIKAVTAKAQSEDVKDFRSDHPQFRLSLLDADHPLQPLRLRQGGSGDKALVEHSNLKFNHQLHLDPGGVRDPKGQRDAAGMQDAQGRPTVLQCADCHVPDASGRLMAPVTMEKNCQRCHSLAFEPNVTQRQVRHGSEEEIATMLREFYARLVLGDVPPDVKPPEDLPRLRPGAAVGSKDRQRALQLAEQKAQQVMQELFETRQVCSTCHFVSRKADGAGWQVKPVRLTQNWLPHALFDHARHTTEKCTTCHEVGQAKTAEHIAIPSIAKCQECHVGAVPVVDKVTSDCASCHKFHAGRDKWHGAVQAAAEAKAQ